MDQLHARRGHGSETTKSGEQRPGVPGKQSTIDDAPSATGMPAPVQSKMEGAFGVDFSSVRIHQGSEAKAMGARAFTRGADIHFAPGQYAPNDQAGQSLLGHELAHVVQQSSGRVAATTQAKGIALNADAALEREADDHGERAARGETIGSSGGRAIAGGNVVQRAKDDEGNDKEPIVKGYPTMEGDEPDEGDIPYDPGCHALITKKIIPALDELDDEALKENRRDGRPTGYMIGVARTSKNTFIGATSGAAPPAVIAVLKRFCQQVVRFNVDAESANPFVENEKGSEYDKDRGRHKIVNGGETGGLAGFCAAFKIAYSFPGVELVGIAECVYAPTGRPVPQIMSGDGGIVDYEHGDLAPSCATCRAALHALLERARRIREQRRPKPVKTVAPTKMITPTKVTQPIKEKPPELTEAEILERNEKTLSDRAVEIAQIPGGLGDLLDHLSKKQEKNAGPLLTSLSKELKEPFKAIAEQVQDDVAVLASNAELRKLLKSVADDYMNVHQLLSVSVNEGSQGTSARSLMNTYEQALQALKRSTQALRDFMASLESGEEGVAEPSDEVTSGTLKSLLSKGVEVKLLGKWGDKVAPSKMKKIVEVTEGYPGNIVNLFTSDDAVWDLDLDTGDLTGGPEQTTDEGTKEEKKTEEKTEDTKEKEKKQETFTKKTSQPGKHQQKKKARKGKNVILAGALTHALNEAMFQVGAQQNFQLNTGGLDAYMVVNNASDQGNNCLIYSIARAAGVEVTTEQIQKIRNTVGNQKDYLGTQDIKTIREVLGVGQYMIVIDTRKQDGARYSVEHFAGSGEPLYIINSNNMHFGWGKPLPGYVVKPDNGDLPGIRFDKV